MSDGFDPRPTNKWAKVLEAKWQEQPKQQQHPMTCQGCGKALDTVLCPSCQRSTNYDLNPTALSGQRGFRNRAQMSEAARELAAIWFKRGGFPVYLEPMKIAPSYAQKDNYLDKGDLHVRLPDDTWALVEVKHTRHVFTCGDDWPMHHYFVIRDDKWKDAQKANRIPQLYVSFNDAMTHVGVVSVPETRNDWRMTYSERRGTDTEWEMHTILHHDIPRCVQWYEVMPLGEPGSPEWRIWDGTTQDGRGRFRRGPCPLQWLAGN